MLINICIDMVKYILGNKENSIVESLYNSPTGTCIFEDELISEKLF